jgi:adenosylmethionine-8-amino-7-oxononanoate aminotransferase
MLLVSTDFSFCLVVSTDFSFCLVQLTALLHGHSYTAHPMGCCAAVKAIQWYQDPSTNSNLDFDHMRLKEVR